VREELEGVGAHALCRTAAEPASSSIVDEWLKGQRWRELTYKTTEQTPDCPLLCGEMKAGQDYSFPYVVPIRGLKTDSVRAPDL